MVLIQKGGNAPRTWMHEDVAISKDYTPYRLVHPPNNPLIGQSNFALSQMINAAGLCLSPRGLCESDKGFSRIGTV